MQIRVKSRIKDVPTRERFSEFRPRLFAVSNVSWEQLLHEFNFSRSEVIRIQAVSEVEGPTVAALLRRTSSNGNSDFLPRIRSNSTNSGAKLIVLIRDPLSRLVEVSRNGFSDGRQAFSGNWKKFSFLVLCRGRCGSRSLLQWCRLRSSRRGYMRTRRRLRGR